MKILALSLILIKIQSYYSYYLNTYPGSLSCSLAPLYLYLAASLSYPPFFCEDLLADNNGTATPPLQHTPLSYSYYPFLYSILNLHSISVALLTLYSGLETEYSVTATSDSDPYSSPDLYSYLYFRTILSYT